MDVAIAVNVEIDQAMTGDLVEHVVEERHAGIDALAAGAVEINGRANAGFLGVTGNVGSTHVRLWCRWIQGGTQRSWRGLATLRREQGLRQCAPVSVRRPVTP